MDRSNLRIADLKQRVPATSRLMNIKVPIQLSETVARLAKQLETSKTEVVVALLNAGLERVPRVRGPIGAKRK